MCLTIVLIVFFFTFIACYIGELISHKLDNKKDQAQVMEADDNQNTENEQTR